MRTAAPQEPSAQAGNGARARGRKILPTDAFEREIRELEFELVGGVDEVGRGALAGPVVAAAVILPPDFSIPGLRDSKLIPEEEREEVYAAVVGTALCWGVGIIDQGMIDTINILQATFAAMRAAVAEMPLRPQYLLIDGRDTPDLGVPSRAVIGGDALCSSIAAASVVAKVTRDRILRLKDPEMPQYGFARHKGYGTREHRRAILEHGPTEFHRQSFLGRLTSAGERSWGEEE